jgi:hypothetical protein
MMIVLFCFRDLLFLRCIQYWLYFYEDDMDICKRDLSLESDGNIRTALLII